MTVLFVLLTFGFFLALDAWSHRHEMVPATIPAHVPEAEALRFEPVWVAGFQVPDGLHYHRGHTWVRAIGPDTAVVGLDDFARRLIGPVSRAKLPEVGQLGAPGRPRRERRPRRPRRRAGRAGRGRGGADQPPARERAGPRHRRPLRPRLAVQGALERARPQLRQPALGQPRPPLRRGLARAAAAPADGALRHRPRRRRRALARLRPPPRPTRTGTGSRASSC